jgi:hypothetical protein
MNSYDAVAVRCHTHRLGTMAHTVLYYSLGQYSEWKTIDFAATLSPGSDASRSFSSQLVHTFLTLTGTCIQRPRLKTYPVDKSTSSHAAVTAWPDRANL